MKKFQAIMISIMAMVGVIALPLAVSAESCGSPVECAQQGVDKTGGDNADTPKLEDSIKTIVNVLLFVLGAIAVIMIIIGGIRYTTSNGDASSVKGAKDTIMYAVVGLVVAILAYAIVNFVLGAFGSK